jgi:hypothetical protein
MLSTYGSRSGYVSQPGQITKFRSCRNQKYPHFETYFALISPQGDHRYPSSVLDQNGSRKRVYCGMTIMTSFHISNVSTSPFTMSSHYKHAIACQTEHSTICLRFVSIAFHCQRSLYSFNGRPSTTYRDTS